MLLRDGPGLGVHGDEREAHLQDPAVHDGFHILRQSDGRLLVHSLEEDTQVREPCAPRGEPGDRLKAVAIVFIGLFSLFPCICIVFLIIPKCQQCLLITEKIKTTTGQKGGQKSVSEGTG